MCDDIDGQCKCGAAKNAACISTSSQPKCLVTAGLVPAAESDPADCQVTFLLHVSPFFIVYPRLNFRLIMLLILFNCKCTNADGSHGDGTLSGTCGTGKICEIDGSCSVGKSLFLSTTLIYSY